MSPVKIITTNQNFSSRHFLTSLDMQPLNYVWIPVPEPWVSIHTKALDQIAKNEAFFYLLVTWCRLFNPLKPHFSHQYYRYSVSTHHDMQKWEQGRECRHKLSSSAQVQVYYTQIKESCLPSCIPWPAMSYCTNWSRHWWQNLIFSFGRWGNELQVEHIHRKDYVSSGQSP